MTILMTADSSGGVWTFAIDLARGLAARGVGIMLAVMGRPLSVEQRRAADRIPGLTLTARPYRAEWMEESLDEVEEAGAWLLDLARTTAPDVVHINGFVHAALPFQAPVLVTAHSCVVSWFHAVKRAAPSSDWLRYEQAVKRGLAGARLVVAPSRAMAMSIIQHYAPHTPVVPIHNGRHPAGFEAGTKEPLVPHHRPSRGRGQRRGHGRRVLQVVRTAGVHPTGVTVPQTCVRVVMAVTPASFNSARGANDNELMKDLPAFRASVRRAERAT